MSNTEMDIYRGAPLADRQQYALTLARAVDILPKALRKVNPQDPNAAREETAARAFLIMETGDMLGLHPMAALAGVNVIEGKPALSSGLMSAVIRSAGHKLHVSEAGTIEGGDYKATATLIREDDPEHPFTSIWTPHRAQRAGLCKYEAGAGGIWKVTARSQGGSALPWESYTESLCKSRAISEVARDGGQDALLGIRYTPEELESGVDDLAPASVESDTDDAPARPARKRATNGAQGTKRKTSTAGTTTPVAMDSDQPAVGTTAPQEDIVDAEVVTDDAEAAERLEREQIAAEQEAAQRAKDEAEEAADRKAKREADVAANQERLRAQADEAKARAHEHEMELAKTATEAVGAGAGVGNFLEEPGGTDGIHPPTEYVDEATGTAYESEAELTAAIKARVQAKQAARAAEPEPTWDAGSPATDWDVALAEEPENWGRLTQAAANQTQLKHVWDSATGTPGAMTSALRAEIIKRKAELPA